MEIWKQLDIYDGRYWISNLGNFKTTYISKYNQASDVADGILLATCKISYLGYKGVGLTINERRTKGRDKGKRKRKYFHVHPLVAKYFVSNIHKYSGIRFKDRDVSNPIASNLEWIERGVDRIFPSIVEYNKYLNELIYEKLDWQDKLIYKYLKGDEKALDPLFKSRNVRQYLGAVILNAGLQNKSAISDIIKDGFETYIIHIKEGRYRIIHSDQKDYTIFSYLSRITKISYYDWLRKHLKNRGVKGIKNGIEVNEHYINSGNQGQNLYTTEDGISEEIVELFNECN